MAAGQPHAHPAGVGQVKEGQQDDHRGGQVGRGNEEGEFVFDRRAAEQALEEDEGEQGQAFERKVGGYGGRCGRALGPGGTPGEAVSGKKRKAGQSDPEHALHMDFPDRLEQGRFLRARDEHARHEGAGLAEEHQPAHNRA